MLRARCWALTGRRSTSQRSVALFVCSSICRHPLISPNTLRVTARTRLLHGRHQYGQCPRKKVCTPAAFRPSTTAGVVTEARPGATRGSLLTLRILPADAVARIGAAYERTMNHDLGRAHR